MSDTGSQTGADDSEGLLVTATIHLTYHTTVAPKPGSKAKAKDQKEVKTKEVKFLFDSERGTYVWLFNVILTKHGEDKYKATEQTSFSIKVLVPPSRAKSDALDIDGFSDYKDLNKKIQETIPSKIAIWADMLDIHKAFSGVSRASASEDPDNHNNDTEIDGLTPMELELARIRGILEKKYRNQHNAGYTYIGPSGTVPLTPLMMLEWARAIYEGEATKNEPPNLPGGAFDPVNRQKSLRNRRSEPTDLDSPTPSSGSDLGHLATIVTTLIGSRGLSTPSRSSPSLDSTSSISNSLPTRPSTPPIYTPSKLRTFLIHAEEKLNVRNALSYETALDNEGFGPDILHLVENAELKTLGIPSRDIIRLKRGAQQWWTGPEPKKAKKKHSGADFSDDNGPSSVPHKFPDAQKVAFEYRSPNSEGKCRFYGPRIEPGSPTARDLNTWYYCEARNTWEPVP
ncbi:hypothetical protein GGX14DRAFT_371289 [Mycena pura]|uniref:Uncharacterized protein n=1 Tax=Mycena pura TaxID=153505 RepID=A0AAD6V724_9AGAR|nr:hypothetical protein GGX14DRAFT_371289 [Mycena pura]